jgi:F0F1-type ATP synthase membrane subunit b/b'
MSGELEAAGALTTAGLAAGAIEGREARNAQEGACLNCGAALAGRYCSQCGQAGHAHRTLLHLIEEVLHGLFHFDTKAWRTLPLLAIRPGTLTRNYIYGKRARYISPLALFLFTIFLMFFVFAFVSVDVFRLNADENRAEIAAELERARAELTEVETALAAEQAARGAAAPDLQQSLRDDARERSIALARGAVARLEDRLERAEDRAEDAIVIDNERAAATGPGTAERPAETRTWQVRVSEAAASGDINVGTPFPQLNERVLHSLENPDLALYKIQQAAYKFSFLLVPISLPFLWLLFIWKRGVTLYDHTVFVLYSLSFASFLFLIIALINQTAWLGWLAEGLMLLGMPAHMFFHLKGAYALGWWSAIWRTSLLLICALISLIIFILTIVLLGLGG